MWLGRRAVWHGGIADLAVGLGLCQAVVKLTMKMCPPNAQDRYTFLSNFRVVGEHMQIPDPGGRAAMCRGQIAMQDLTCGLVLMSALSPG